MIQDILRALHFSDKESTIYLALIKIGSCTPAILSRKTGLNRTTIYDLLEILSRKGLVSNYKKGASTYFFAHNPRELAAYFEREKNEYVMKAEKLEQGITSIIPELISLQNQSSTKPKVQFFEGERGLREAYEDTLSSKGRILAYTNVEEMFEALPNFFPEYFKRRAKSKIAIDAVFVQNEKSRERAKRDNEELRRTKFLPDPSLTFSPEVKIYNDKMLIASWKEKMAIIIESKEFVDQQRIIFNLLWNSLT